MTHPSSVRNETASPGYYAAELPDCGATFELTITAYAVLHRYRFAGGTSAWYVWSCLGLSPLAGTPYVFLVSPTVNRVKLHFAVGGELTIRFERTSAKAIYPAAISLNGIRLSEPWLTVSALQRGGALVFEMAETPFGRSPIPSWPDEMR